MIHIARRSLHVENNRLVLSKKDAHYLFRVRRVRNGDKFTATDGTHFYKFILKEDKNELFPEMEISAKVEKSKYRITAIIPLADLNAVESAIRNSVQAGADNLSIIRTKFSNTFVKTLKKKRNRHEKIILDSCSQSRRKTIPSVEFSDFQSTLESPGLHLIMHPGKKALDFSSIPKRKNIYVWTGPEGGFSPEETAEFSKNNNAFFISLNTPILRMENAVTAGVAITRHLFP